MTTRAYEQGSENLRGMVKVTQPQPWVMRYSHVVWRFPKCVFWKDHLVHFGLGVHVRTINCKVKPKVIDPQLWVIRYSD